MKKKHIEFIQNIACEQIIDILNAIGCNNYTVGNEYIHAPCPIHGGDNPRAFFFAINSNHWQCKTRCCHLDPITGPSTSVFGLVRGVMSHKSKRQWTFKETVDFVNRVLHTKTNINPYHKKQITPKTKTILPKHTLASFTDLLKPDLVYYPKRGVSLDIISKYHISLCVRKEKPMYRRAFFPILDITGKYVIGWSGRSIDKQCNKCMMYHPPGPCPNPKYYGKYTKWRHSKGFKKSLSLYNIWYAKSFIKHTKTAILCEGSGDVWAHEAAGIHNSVALFGTSISDVQRLLLQKVGALTVICSLDNDDAGKIGSMKLQEKLKDYFKVICIRLNNVNDIANMSPTKIKTLYNGVIE